MISIRDLHINAGDFELRDINLEVPAGTYAVLMGRSGSGKTTILECLCGLHPVTSGTICINDHDVGSKKPGERGIGYVPQDTALFATMTVRANLSFALDIRRTPADKTAARVTELAAMLQLSHLLDRSPAGLSGGEARRVALGRALVHQPAILLLDEPLTALDDKTREEMLEILVEVRKRSGVTALHVTHSRREMERLADTLFVLEDGRVRTDKLTAFLQG